MNTTRKVIRMRLYNILQVLKDLGYTGTVNVHTNINIYGAVVDCRILSFISCSTYHIELLTNKCKNLDDCLFDAHVISVIADDESVRIDLKEVEKCV